MPLDPDPLKDILYRTTARYLTVRPKGIELDHQLLKTVQGRVLAYGGARTLYRGRRPHCRSLDGLSSLKGQACSECLERKHCTPQVRLDILIDALPYRLLLAFTSAKHFLLYVGSLGGQALDVTKVQTRIDVVDRNSWGELRFRRVSEGPTSPPPARAPNDPKAP